MSRVLALRALSSLPSDIKKTILAKVFPTVQQLVSRLRRQSPSQPSFTHLDVAIISFVYSDQQKITLARLVGPQRNWVIARCKLFRLNYQDVKTIGGKGLTLIRPAAWAFDEDTEVCKLRWCKTRWRYRCRYCDLATNFDPKQVFVRVPRCPMCFEVHHPLAKLLAYFLLSPA